MLKQTRIIQIFVIFILFVQVGITKDKVMVKHKSNGSIFTTEVSNIDTLTFTENFVKDFDGNVYKTIMINGKEWMAENLRVTHYNEGTPIPLEGDILIYPESPAYFFYDNSIYNAINYGCLYNWHAVKDNRNIAPGGWHVPSDQEWTELENFLGSDAGKKLKSTSGWSSNGNGTDDYGFNALPAGLHLPVYDYAMMGLESYFWSSTANGNLAWTRCLSSINKTLLIRAQYAKKYGLSVRCVKD